MLHRESRERKEQSGAKERARAIASIRDAQEQADRDAWMSARGIIGGPAGKALTEHAARPCGLAEEDGHKPEAGVFTAPSTRALLHARPGSRITRPRLFAERFLRPIVDPGRCSKGQVACATCGGCHTAWILRQLCLISFGAGIGARRRPKVEGRRDQAAQSMLEGRGGIQGTRARAAKSLQSGFDCILEQLYQCRERR